MNGIIDGPSLPPEPVLSRHGSSVDCSCKNKGLRKLAKKLKVVTEIYSLFRSGISYIYSEASIDTALKAISFQNNETKTESVNSEKTLIPEECSYFSGLITSVKDTIDDILPEGQPLSKRENWMRDMYLQSPSFGNRHLWSISLPGTHHSAVRNVSWAFGKEYAICQRATIQEQLDGGIRFFDLRVCDDKPKAIGEIWMSHHFVSHAEYSNTIKEIGTFVKTHEKEIVIISVTRDKGRSLSLDGEKKVNSILTEEFGDALIYNDEIHKTLDNLWEKGKKVALTGNLIPNGCQRQSSWSLTKSKNHKNLIANISAYLNENPKFSPGILQLVEAQITNRGISAPNDWNSKKLNPKLPKKLNNDWSKAEINVFLHDFTDDKIIHNVISRNRVT